MTEDILTTFVCIVENILKRRLLTSVLDDIDSYEAITSNYFLIGSSGSEMFRTYSKNFKSNQKNFKAAQQNAIQIWRRFQKEYIPMHLARNRGLTDQKTQFQEGELNGW